MGGCANTAELSATTAYYAGGVTITVHTTGADVITPAGSDYGYYDPDYGQIADGSDLYWSFYPYSTGDISLSFGSDNGCVDWNGGNTVHFFNWLNCDVTYTSPVTLGDSVPITFTVGDVAGASWWVSVSSDNSGTFDVNAFTLSDNTSSVQTTYTPSVAGNHYISASEGDNGWYFLSFNINPAPLVVNAPASPSTNKGNFFLFFDG